MRIVAGEWKGRAIEAPSGRDTRPTTDRVREALFSALWARLGGFEGLRVLDAFAGSGALGLEALSRGAARCVFFDADEHARKAVRRNAGALKLSPERFELRGGDVFAAARAGGIAGGPFGLVLLDPPYAVPAAQVAGLCADLAARGALAPGALVSYEHARGADGEVDRAFADMPGFARSAAKSYGKIAVALLSYSG